MLLICHKSNIILKEVTKILRYVEQKIIVDDHEVCGQTEMKMKRRS